MERTSAGECVRSSTSAPHGSRQGSGARRQGRVKRFAATAPADLDLTLVTDVLYLLLTVASFALLALLVGVLDK